MKTKTLGLFAIPVIAALMFGVSASTQLAAADPALVIKGTNCGVFNGNGIVEAIVGRTHTVITDEGVTKLTCKGEVTPADNGRAAIFTFDDIAQLCGTLGGSTDDWRNIVSADGKVTLQCFIHP